MCAQGKQQMIISAFAKALEVIPRQLSDNAGLDSTDILNRLRKEHAHSGTEVCVSVLAYYAHNCAVV
jgi:T-complex protein 1 subunit eta